MDYALRDTTIELTNTALLEQDADLFGGVLGLDHSLRHSITTQHLLQAADSLSEADREKLLKQARDGFDSTLTLANRITLWPLRGAPAWANSALTYDLDLRLLHLAYVDDRVRADWGSWDSEGVTRHRLEARSEVQVADHPQRLTLSADLPPRPHLLSANLALAAGAVSASADTGFRCREDRKLTLLECGDWEPQPLNVTLQAQPLEPLSLQQQFSIDLAPAARVARSVSTLGLGGFSAGLIVEPREDVPGRSDKPLGLRQLRLDYNETLGPAYWWRDRVKLELAAQAGWTINFPQPRNNRLTLSTTVTANVHEFLDLTFSTSSSNDRTFLYLPDWARQAGVEPLNPLEDLLRSFAFWDEELRRRSNFKIDEVRLNAVHHLQDWDLTVGYTARPREKDGELDLSSEFSIVVQWLPVPEIRSRLSGDGDSFSLDE